MLLTFCPVGAVLGSLAHAITISINLKKLPRNEEDIKIASKELQEKRGAWLGLRLFLGAILGLVLGLYFVGAIQENPATLAKIIALSIIAGYAAPKIWESQEKIIDHKLKNLSNPIEDTDKNT